MPAAASRLLALLSLLQARPRWTAPVLAQRLAVSPRTVRRDVDRLRALGYTVGVTRGPGAACSLGEGSRLPPLLLDDDQAVAVALALRTATTSVAGLDEDASRALAVLRQVVPPRLRARVDAVEVTAVGGRGPVVDPAVLLAISTAVLAHEVLRLDLETVEGVARRRVEPHHLLTWGGRWYLVGFDLDRENWRTFRVDRLVPRTPTGPRFTPREVPGGDVAAWVVERFQRFDRAQAWPVHGEVVLRIEAGTIADRVRGSVVEDLGQGRARVVLGAWSWPALAATVALFDADVERAEPAQLRVAFRALAARAAAAGGPAGPS